MCKAYKREETVVAKRGGGQSGSEMPDATRVIVCFDMWDSLVDRQVGAAEAGPNVDFWGFFEPVDRHNDVISAEFELIVNSFSLTGRAHVVKLLGDGMMFVFPPEMADVALLFVIRSMQNLDRKKTTSVAISCGEVDITEALMASRFSTITRICGYPVDVASRLVGVAQGGQVLVCAKFVKAVSGCSGLSEFELGEKFDVTEGGPTRTNHPNNLAPEETSSRSSSTITAICIETATLQQLTLPGSGVPSTWTKIAVTQIVAIDGAEKRALPRKSYGVTDPSKILPIFNRYLVASLIGRLLKGFTFANLAAENLRDLVFQVASELSGSNAMDVSKLYRVRDSMLLTKETIDKHLDADTDELRSVEPIGKAFSKLNTAFKVLEDSLTPNDIRLGHLLSNGPDERRVLASTLTTNMGSLMVAVGGIRSAAVGELENRYSLSGTLDIVTGQIQ